MDSKADFTAMMTELQVPDKAQEWLLAQGFSTVSDLAFTFVNSADGAALLSKLPEKLWTDMGVDLAAEEYSTTVPAGKLRRLLAQAVFHIDNGCSYFDIFVSSGNSSLARTGTSSFDSRGGQSNDRDFSNQLSRGTADFRDNTLDSLTVGGSSLHETRPGHQVHPLADSDVPEAVPRHDGGQDPQTNQVRGPTPWSFVG